MKIYKLVLFSATLFAMGCTKLDEKLNGEVASIGGAGGTANIPDLINGVYSSMRGPYQDQARLWAAQEHTTDEVLGPTRGGDWDDNGIWRVMHAHKWDANHQFLNNTFTELGRVIFGATDILRFSNATAAEKAEARFLRAYANYSMLDGWDQVPYREPGGDILDIPKVRKGSEALNYIITELEQVIADLPFTSPRKANKDAAKGLLMRCYLSKGVMANRAAPTFAQADMNKVIALANEIMISPRGYGFTSNYFDNFSPANDAIGTENIFTAENIGGSSSGNVRSRWFCTLHYNNNPSGWNGFTTLSDFYDKFDAADKRRGGNSYPGMTSVSGLRPGFLIGQQFDQNGVALKDRNGAPLAFTRAVKIKEVNNNLEVTGIRVVKYPIDYASGDNSNNDYVYIRLADVMLMKAEAILRGGTDPNAQTALGIVNSIRTHVSRGAPALASVDLNGLLDERGRELYWEGHRRSDLIRFGKFLGAWQEKAASSATYLVFPIPAPQLAVNPNLTQNPGY